MTWSYALVNNIWLKIFGRKYKRKFIDLNQPQFLKKQFLIFPGTRFKNINSTQSNLWKINNITTILKHKT